ncbi:HAMP domain-containing sensor histidine kinase [Nonomuraea helvata]|uniref:HAMP domain-containing sensor histidine kinase n=1 Tax=Nonomuraea helvata TaxID=37484 RepID=UPI003370502C
MSTFSTRVARLRKHLARTPLWLRLVSATLLLVTLAITLTGVFAVRLLRGYLVERVDQQLIAATRPLRDPPPMAEQPRPGGRPQRFFGLFYAVLLDPSGTPIRTLSESTEEHTPALPKLDLLKVVALNGRPFTVESLGTGGPSWRVVAVPGRDGESRVIAVNLSEVDATVSQLVLIVAVAGGGTLVVLGLACYWLVRRSLRPLREIARTAKDIAGGDLSRRVPLWAGTTEVGKLGRSLNSMLAQIEAAAGEREAAAESARRSATAARRSEELMRRFMADASHELRTPLTSIRGFAELYRLGEEKDLAEAVRLLSRIEGQAARMGLLVEDMLLLARLDQRRELAMRPVDLLSLAATVVIDAQTLAPDRKIELVRLFGGEGGRDRDGRRVAARAGAQQPRHQRAHPHAGRHVLPGAGRAGRRPGRGGGGRRRARVSGGGGRAGVRAVLPRRPGPERRRVGAGAVDRGHAGGGARRHRYGGGRAGQRSAVQGDPARQRRRTPPCSLLRTPEDAEDLEGLEGLSRRCSRTGRCPG